jgi:DmsE family decaheme c-type cytochrome
MPARPALDFLPQWNQEIQSPQSQGGDTVFNPYRRKHALDLKPRILHLTGILIVGLALLTNISCRSTSHQVTRRTEPNLDAGWPRANNFFTQVSYQAVKGQLPVLEGAEYVNDDEICGQCHEAYVKSFANNVHRGDSCESCHGPASRHVETRGKETGLIFSFKQADPITRAEACLRCHEENQCAAGAQWRTSRHAQCRVDCVQCHRAHYNVPPGTPATSEPGASAPLPGEPIVGNRLQNIRDLSNVSLQSRQTPQGYVKPEKNLPSLRGTSHSLGAVAPGTCYRCHTDMRVFQEIAGPHQICGPNGFNCTTCHNPHGQIIEFSRQDLCLQCHGNCAPTMAFQSSTHFINGVHCTDCHNPHPTVCVPAVVNINHYQIVRPKRMQMSVQEPEACYKCHPKIYGLNALPSHHPIKEGKMVCSDCHDAHGQTTDNIREATINLLCYKCHADKQGPYAFEHPPVRENCAICHEPHGTVANNLLRQPPTFLCLRCHAGHHAAHTFSGAVAPLRVQNNPSLRPELYTDCTQCHQQIHGSDRVSQHGAGWMQR